MSLQDVQSKLKKIAMPVELSVKSVDIALKSYLSCTDIELSIKYSDFGQIPIRYNGEKSETLKDYLRVRSVDDLYKNADAFRVVAKRTQSTVYVLHTDDPEISFYVIADYKLFKEMNKTNTHMSKIIQELFLVDGSN